MNPLLKPIRFFTLAIVCFGLMALTACEKSSLDEAKRLERLGRHASALSGYESVAAKDPKGAAEARFRSAEIYRNVLRDYPRARRLYAEISGRHPGTAWADKAAKALAHCPDYFPLNPDFVRRSGDSQSGGKYMLMVDELEPLQKPAGRFRMKRKIFAGSKMVSTFERIYEQTPSQLNEFPLGAGEPAVLLRYPVAKGLQWESKRDGKRTLFEVESEDERVKIAAGEFEHCLKVLIRNSENDESWKVEYYAPDVGLILSAAATQEGETRVSELISYLDRKSPLNAPVPAETIESAGTSAKPYDSGPGFWKNLVARFRKKPATAVSTDKP